MVDGKKGERRFFIQVVREPLSEEEIRENMREPNATAFVHGALESVLHHMGGGSQWRFGHGNEMPRLAA